MVNNKIWIVILISFCVQMSCKVREKSPVPSNPEDFASIDTIWRAEIRDYSITPILNSNSDIITSKVANDPNGEIFQLYDGLTGKLKWEWQDYFFQEYSFYGNQHLFYKDVLLLSSRNTTYSIDAISGKTLWRDYQDTLFGDNFLTGDEDGFIYHGFRPFKNGNRLLYIWRTRYDELNWEPVCVFEEPLELERLRMTNLIVVKNNLGEKLMVYTLSIFRQINGERKESSKMVAYNLSTKKIVWEVDNSSQNVDLTFWKTKMLSKENKVFIFGVVGQTYFLNAYNLSNGDLIWSKSISDFGLELFLYKDKIVPIVNRSKTIEALDINTGGTLWVQTFEEDPKYDITFGFHDSKIYKNMLVSTLCNNLLALNLEQGRVVYYDRPKIMYDCLQFGLAINEEKRWFYVQDRKYINCYTLPFQIK